MGSIRQLMNDLGFAKSPSDWSYYSDKWKDPAILKPAQITTIGTFADEYLTQPAPPAKAVTSSLPATASAERLANTMAKMDEGLQRQKKEREERDRIRAETGRALTERKTASLCWMARHHSDKLGRHAKANIVDLQAGRLPGYRGAFQLDAELIECCHLANFRRDPERPPNHSFYVDMVERAVQNWDEKCAEDLMDAASSGGGGDQLKAQAERARKEEEAKAQAIAHELAEQQRHAREAVERAKIAAAEARQADVGAVVDALLDEQAGGEW